MKKSLLLFLVTLSTISTFAQPSGMLGETFRLKYIETNNTYYTPNGENPNLTIYEVAGNYVLDADGIFNTLNAAVNFDGNSLTLNDYAVTLHDCVEPNCYYENIYFYDILTTVNFDSKTFTYYYNENNGYKYLRLKDSENNMAYFSTEPAPEPNPLLFQTWYLEMIEVDMGDPIFYTGPNPPQISINPDFTYTGLEDCALISGDFILRNADEYYDFILQSRNYVTDETNCPPGPVDYVMWELEYGIPLRSYLYVDNNGNDSFEYETSPGFISHFSNLPPLSTPESSLSNLKIYPNPVSDKLFINSIEDAFSYTVTDINGRIIISRRNNISNEIDVSSLKPGMYFLIIQNSEAVPAGRQGKVTTKFIKI